MPRLPDATTLGERPSPQLGGRVPAYRGTSGAETVPGEALMRLGQTVGNVSDAVKVEEARTDTIVSEDAFNRLREKQINLTIGEKEGFVHQKGSLVLDGKMYTDYTTRFDEAVGEIGSGLSNNRQRDLFRQRAGMANLQYKENLLQHIVREKDAFAKQVFDKGVELETRDVALRWQDPNAIAMSLTRVNGLISAESDREMWPAQKLEALRSEAVSKIHASVVANALSSDNYAYAQKWFDAHKEEITGQEAVTLKKALEEGGIRTQAQQQTDMLLKKTGGDYGLAIKEADKINDEKIREVVKSKLDMASTRDERAKKLRSDEEFSHALRIVSTGGETADIPPDTYVNLSPAAHRVLAKVIADKVNGTEPVLDQKAWAAFSELSRDRIKLATLPEAEFYDKYLLKLDKPRRERAAALREAAVSVYQKEDKKADDFLRNDLTLKNIARSKIMDAGLVTPGKKPSQYTADEREILNSYEEEVTLSASKQLEQFQVAHKRKATTEEEEKIVNDLVMKEVRVKTGPSWWSTEKRLAELTPEDITSARVGYKKVPISERNALSDRAIRLGVKPDEDAIAHAYTTLLLTRNLPAAERRMRIDVILKGRK